MDKYDSEQEIVDAISHLKNNKAAECNGTPAEIFKAFGGDLVKHSRIIFHKICNKGDIPQNFKQW